MPPAEDEAPLAQEKTAALRLRFLMVGQSSADILQRTEQAREASARLGATQEDLALWLARMEKALLAEGGRTEGGLAPSAAADTEKVRCQAGHGSSHPPPGSGQWGGPGSSRVSG